MNREANSTDHPSMKNILQPFAAALMLSACLTGLAQAVPPLINYQGQLLDAAGTPMPTGDYSVEVRLFPVESGGGAIWGPQVFNGQSGIGYGPKVAVVNGRFNLVLGPQDANSNNLAGVFGANASVYIELKVGIGNPISPRQQVLSAPFALSAANAAYAANATNALDAANAANAAKLNGYDWTALFPAGNPQSGDLSVASATVRGDLTVGAGGNNYHKVILNGGNSLGFLYGSYPKWGDGIHLGYNYYADANGADQPIHSDGPTSRISVQYGRIVLATGGTGLAPTTERLVVDTSAVTVFGTFNNFSDRNAKKDFAPVSPSQILDKVAQLPISEWSYKVDSTTRHIGPMAQDFYATFNVGTDDRHIAPIDEGGVAFAAIQALNRKVEEKDGQLRQLERRVEQLEQLLRRSVAGAP
jgi:hypothetical protein